MERHCDSGGQKLRDKFDRESRIAWHIAWNLAACGSELRLDAHLQGRNAGFKPCSIDRKPVALPEVEEHGRIAAGRYHSSRRRLALDFVVSQMLGPLRAFHAVFPEKQVFRAAIRIQDRLCVGKCFDLARPFLAIVAIARGAQDRRADRFELNASARAPSNRSVLLRRGDRLLPLCGA